MADKDMKWKTLSQKYLIEKPWLTARVATGRYRLCGMTDGPVSLSVNHRRSASQSSR